MFKEYDDANDLDHIVEGMPGIGISGDLSAMGKELATMKGRVEYLKMQLKNAEQEYVARNHKYADFFLMQGVRQIMTDDGLQLNVATAYHCSPNKNDDDKAVIRAWLTERGEEGIIKTEYLVPADYEAVLQKSGIPHVRMDSVNTTSLKALIKHAVERGEITIEDIPKCIHFAAFEEVIIK